MLLIITDAESRKGYDIINILKYVYGYELILFSSKGYSLALPAIYRQKVHRLDTTDYESFCRDFEKGLSRYHSEEFCYLAVSEKVTLHFYEYQSQNLRYSRRIKALVPSLDAFQLCRNKIRFQRFCETKGFPAPKSYKKDTITDLEQNFEPVIAKLNIGTGSVGMHYISEPDQLQKLRELDFDQYLVQKIIKSDKNIHGAFFLCHEGEVITYHGHRRLRTFPEKGGVTVFSGSDFNEDIKDIGSKVLKELNWSGFAMIEFMFDTEDEEWKIIELNPRLWGSVMLSEFCGSKLLDSYVQLCNSKAVKTTICTDNSSYIKWIFPFEILNLLKRKISLSEFMNTPKRKICYINFTYGKYLSNILFLSYFTVNADSIGRFIKKLTQ